MLYKEGDRVIVRSRHTILEENPHSNEDDFYMKDGLWFNAEKAAYCDRLMYVGQVRRGTTNSRYKLVDPLSGEVVHYKNNNMMYFSNDLLYAAIPASEISVAVGSTVWVRPWPEIVAQADYKTDIAESACTVNTIWITEGMKNMCCKKYKILHITSGFDDVTVVNLMDENGTTWNFPLNTLYGCCEIIPPAAAQPILSFEDLFGKEE